jgi:hypothetical protein
VTPGSTTFRVSRATIVGAVAILVATLLLAAYVHRTLSDIERALPLKILEQRKDIAGLEEHVGALSGMLENIGPD